VGCFAAISVDPWIESFDLSWDREFGRVCCSVSSEMRVSGEGGEGGENSRVDDLVPQNFLVASDKE
jgi:hypothetical protein